jgi:hypothetical protein
VLEHSLDISDLKNMINVKKLSPVRSATSNLTVTVFGGNGFVGRYLLNSLGCYFHYLFCYIINVDVTCLV